MNVLSLDLNTHYWGELCCLFHNQQWHVGSKTCSISMPMLELLRRVCQPTQVNWYSDRKWLFVFCIFILARMAAHSTDNNTGHTHPFSGPLSGTTRMSRYQKGKTNLDFTEARYSEWQWHQLEHMHVRHLLYKLSSCLIAADHLRCCWCKTRHGNHMCYLYAGVKTMSAFVDVARCSTKTCCIGHRLTLLHRYEVTLQ